MPPAPLEPGSWRSLARAAEAIGEGRKRGAVLVWGHDDLDGTTSTAIVLRSLRARGFQAEYYIPPRSATRYGLDPEVFRDFPARGVGTLVTVDCGVKDAVEAGEAARLGLSVVITDHHQPPPDLSPAVLMVNPKIPENPRPTPELAGCGVALYLAAALAGSSGEGWLQQDRESLAWAALGTISDRVPLVGENRAIVRQGLPALAGNPVFQRAAEMAGFDISAGLSPAVLRRTMVPLLGLAESSGHRHQAVELMLGDLRPERVKELRRRQTERAGELEKSFTRLASSLDPSLPYILAVDENLGPGMAGSLASKFRDETGKPAIVAAPKNGLLAGECRGSLPFDFVEFLDSISRVFVQHGGHRQAAGFTVSPGAEAEFLKLARAGFESRKGLMLIPVPEADPDYGLKSLKEIAGIATELAERAPFGPGNPMPAAAVSEAKLPGNDGVRQGPWILRELLGTKNDGELAGPVTVHLDITHTGTVLVNLKPV